MKKWLDKYQSKGEVKKGVYQYTPQNLVNPNFNGLAATTYDVTPTNNMLPEVVIKAKRIKPQANFHLNLQNQIFANNTRENVLDNRRNYYFPYETEQTKNIRNLADDQVFKSSGDLVSAIHPVGAIINALYQGADESLPFEGISVLPNNIPFKQARTYNNLIPILKPLSRIIDPIQMFDKLRIADSLYKSADSIDLYNQFKHGGLVSKNSLNRKVTCSNCGWSWKLSDGGMDPMTCHKCGGDIKMREGGELDQYQDKGQVNFRDQLFQKNKPIVDRGNFSNVAYTPAQQAAMQNANLVRKNEEKKKLQDEIAARQSKEKGTPYKLPTGVTKKYKDMTLKERAYVDAQSLRNKGRWNENSVEQPFLNNFNPITMLYDMAAGLGEAPLMSDVTNSYMPYVTGVVAPLTVGAFAGIGAKTTGQFVNNLVNPLAGTGQIIDNIMFSPYVKGLKVPKPTSVSSSVDDVGRGLTQAPQPWQMQELPGLHLKSTMSGSPLEKQLSKTGEISKNNIIAHINKAETSAADKFTLQKVLDQKFPNQNKIDYNDFRKAVSDEAIELERKVVANYQHNNWGLDRLGYPNAKRSTYDFSIKSGQDTIQELERKLSGAIEPTSWETSDQIRKNLEIQLSEAKAQLAKNLSEYEKLPLENISVIYGNPTKFGRGNAKHFEEHTLGHARTLVSPEEPNIMHFLEQQSDWWQNLEKTKPINLEKYKEVLTRQEARYLEDLETLKKLKETKMDYAGNPKSDWEIAQFEDIVNKKGAELNMRKGDIFNPQQKEFLGKAHQERLLQENVKYAAEQGKSSVRFPTSETAIKIQGYTPKILKNELNGHLENLTYLKNDPDFIKIPGDEILPINDYGYKSLSETPITKNEYLKLLNERINKLKSLSDKELNAATYSPKHQTIIKKYSEQPKTIKKLFGTEPKIVTDSKGNTWYEFDIPEKFKKGKGEIKAFGLAPYIGIGGAGAIGAGALQQNKYGGQWLDKYQSKGEVKQSFRDQLFQRNKPIVDKTAAPILLPPNLNYDKTRVVNSSSRGLNKTQLKNINQNLRNRAEQEKKQELEGYRAAQLFHNNNPVAQFLGTRSAPVSSVKPTARELAYGLGAGINEFYDIPGIGIVNDFANPLSVVSKGMISPWAQAPLQAQQSDSYLPYLGAAASTALTIPMVRPASMAAKGIGRYLTEKTALNTLHKAKNFREALGTFKGIPTERSLPRLSPEELKVYRQVQEIGRMRATNKPISEQYRYALQQNIPDEHFEKVFGKSKSEVEKILPDIIEQESIRSSIPIRERFNLERPPRRRSSSDAAIDQMNNELNIRTASPEEIQRFADRVGMSVDEVTQLAQSSLPQQTRDETIRRALTNLAERTYNPNELSPIPEELIINAGSNRGRTIINSQSPRLSLLETAMNDLQRNKYITSGVVDDKFTNIISEYPYYKGPVLENVPSLSLSTSGSLKNVSKKVGDQSVSGISSGDMFTGSLNTSHSSYLPQLKQIFKYNQGAPHFLGYKPMNHLGFLSDFNYSTDDIARYLNTEIDEQIKRGILPDNILRPYSTNNPKLRYQSVKLPHYGIKQFKKGGALQQNKYEGQWLDKYQSKGEVKQSFRDQLFQRNTPIVDRGNFSKVAYTPAQQAAMQNAILAQKNAERRKLQEEISARQAKEKGTVFTLPTGASKKYKDMNVKERAYVDAQSLRNKGRWNENQVEQPFLNMFNPITMLYDMAAGLGEAPLMSDVTNSYMPYVTGIGVPLVTGAFAGIGANSTGQFVNNLVNPLAGENNLRHKFQTSTAYKTYINGIRKGQNMLDKVLNMLDNAPEGFKKVTTNLVERAPFSDMIKSNLRYYLNRPMSPADIKTANFLEREKGALFTNNGGYNDGVFYLKRFPDHLVKVENIKHVTGSTQIPDYGLFDFVNATKNLNKDNVAKIISQIPLENDRRALIMNKLKGKSIYDLTADEFKNLDAESVKNLFDDLKDIRNNNLGFDYLGDNMLYDPESRSFKLIDLSPIGGDEYSWWNSRVLKGISNNVGVEESAARLREELTKKLGDHYATSLEKELFYGHPSGLSLNTRDSYRDKRIKQFKRSLKILLNKQSPYKEGGVINDDRGQWAHPGKVTRINSNNITMQGVPYPVVGVSNTGHTQYMMPGQEYQYDGDYVTEYPMMQGGGQMIKRADGSYSRPGLWDNIRKNAGSGKKPTAQMLEQERKIRNKYQSGGEQDVYWRTGLPMVNDPSMDTISKVLLYRNQDKNFMQRAAGFGYQGGIPTRYIEGQDPNSNNTSNLLMSFGDNQVFPTIIQTAPQQLSYQPDQYQEYIETPSWDVADYFSTKGYKRAANDMYGMEYAEGGGIPERYKNMGFTKVGAKKQSTRPGKKWMVLAKKGDDYKVIHGGYKGMQDFKQHHSEQRRENFWNRMGGRNSSKATDPFSPLYWHKRFGTWQEGGQTSPDMEYASNYIYRYPATTFPCQGKGCSEQVSDELVQMGLTPQRTDAWFMNDAVQQSGGKEIWNQKNNTPVDYKNIRVGDIISLDRPGLNYVNKKKKKNKYKPEMDVEHVGVIVGFNENGVPLVKHGGADENTVVQPINDVFLNVLSTGIKLNYNPYSIYRLAGADTFIPNQKYYDKYYENIKPVLEKIQPLDIKTDKLTLDKEKFISALNNNLEKQSRILGISPNDVQQLQKIAYGIFGNESTFNASQYRNIKEPIKRIFYGLNLTDNSPSLGVTRIKYDDLVNKNTTKIAKIFSDLGVKKNKLQGLKSDLEYNDEANATVGLLGYYFNKLKEKDENGNYKYNFNPKTNTVFDNIPIGIAVASLYNRPAGLKNYKKRIYPHKAYNYIKEDMTSLPLFQVNLDPISIKSTDEKYIDNKLKQSAIELPENLRIPQLPFMNISSRNYYYKIGGQSTLNPIVKKDNRNWLDYLKN